MCGGPSEVSKPRWWLCGALRARLDTFAEAMSTPGNDEGAKPDSATSARAPLSPTLHTPPPPSIKDSCGQCGTQALKPPRRHRQTAARKTVRRSYAILAQRPSQAPSNSRCSVRLSALVHLSLKLCACTIHPSPSQSFRRPRGISGLCSVALYQNSESFPLYKSALQDAARMLSRCRLQHTCVITLF
ncbi:uncharacterized protein CC84DRAFT_896964 [Paraphaeosphaeria sporulosa]|uniref:Uncharacterized protein n=1 Tax=Paraphaeosphaeria sporulosa TaxID=1460663 RepID=A0A177C521_9PLEO|nr:uncharacterized protein CC84DRAFT_896964 [Paraphaeosphaeria sporulosa]OAG02536.1 hypothetical protein CC84DRAFT_896964 [Paraphaeosphaeria sporulosa]